MDLGYHVFRALAPACPCDLIAMRGDDLFRIEVKTACFPRAGRSWTVSRPTHTGYDFLAVVVPRTGVLLFPASMAHEDIVDSVRVQCGHEPAMRHGVIA